MSSYICPRCNYATNRKSNFKHHITRKNLCKPINSDVTIKSIAKSYGIDLASTENVGVIQKVIRITESDESEKLSGLNNKIEHRCKFCNQSFKHKSNKSRHEKYRCKKRTNINKTDKTNKTIYTKEEVEQKIKEVQEETDAKVELVAQIPPPRPMGLDRSNEEE